MSQSAQLRPSAKPAHGKQQQSSALSLFPPRPPRTGLAPGRPVKLQVNLYRMSLNQEKVIYSYSVEIDIVSDIQAAGDKEKAVQKKLSKELRRKVLDRTLVTWLSNAKPKDYKPQLAYNYLFDANGSMIYTLFDMFSNQGSKELEFNTKLDVETIKSTGIEMVERTFRVRIIKCKVVDMQHLFKFCKGGVDSDITTIQEQLRALNVILRGKIHTIPVCVMTTFNIFPFVEKYQFKVGPGVLASRGFFMSARPTETGLVLNIANTVAAFYEPIELTSLLTQKFGVRDLKSKIDPMTLDKFKKELKNKQIEAKHRNFGTKDKPHYRKYRINDISGSAMDEFMLVDKVTKETQSISIKAYFAKEYKYNLQYPNLPCVIDRGSKIPLEVCRLIDKQRVARKMDPLETAEIIKRSAVPARQHFDYIEDHLNALKNNLQPLDDFGLKLDCKPIEVTGRELTPLELSGPGNKPIRPMNGAYDARSCHFVRPTTIKRWAIVFLNDMYSKRDFQQAAYKTEIEERFREAYLGGARAKGVQINPQANIYHLDGTQQDMPLKLELKKFFMFLNQNQADHVLFILPNRCPEWAYRYLQYLEVLPTGKGRPTTKCTRVSCIKYDNVVKKVVRDRQGGQMFISNLWLKYNTKLGGVNFVLKKSPSAPFLNDGVLFVSIDICHPAPGDQLPQSVSAMVGMWDLTDQISYCTQLRVQKKARENQSTIEEVLDIDKMFERILQAYKNKKKRYPQCIIILRDGVSEGQFKMVLQGELSRVMSMVSNKYTADKIPLPKLACMVVQKRHKVRFLRKEPVINNRGIADHNIQPGTVVDTDVVHPRDFNFYIAPHKAIQGTSKPSHIYMMCDTIGMSQDHAQSMIHALSYLSPRCTKSTSIPTPVNLADLAAERAKNIVISWNDDHREKMPDAKRMDAINAFLSELGEPGYENTLFYV